MATRQYMAGFYAGRRSARSYRSGSRFYSGRRSYGRRWTSRRYSRRYW